MTVPRPVRRGIDVAGSALVVALLLVVSAAGVGGLPALGGLLSPTGIWRLSPDAGTATGEFIMLPALSDDATVTFEENGLAHVHVDDDQDLFRVIGYLHARFRLSEMDLARRSAGGRLSEILGSAGLESDQFQVELGLQEAAERDWASMDEAARAVLVAYAEGVNAARSQLIDGGRLPMLFKLLGYTPAQWSPVDSLLVQRSVTQTLSFTDLPLRYQPLAEVLPAEAFHEWFPVIPANDQHPYDSGPYLSAPLAELPVGSDLRIDAAAPATGLSMAPSAAGDEGLAPLRRRLEALPDRQVHRFGNSNSWAVSGDHTASGGALLATDPHLNFSLPSIWYQVEGRSPGYGFTGVTIPGIPLPLMGKTDSFAWAITNSQRPATLFYEERTDAAHPGQYLWQGQWRDMTSRTYEIPVKGQEPVRHEVRFTVHGPVLQALETTASVWWAGVLPSTNIKSTMDMLRAGTFDTVRESFRGWATPALNVTYADRAGNIGAFNVGVAPQIGGDADIGLPLTGTGADDIVGSIEFAALPKTYNPPSGIVVAANQRETTGAYPYDYGTSYTYPDQGWRADEIVAQLQTAGPTTAGSSADMQLDQRDNLARWLIPHLLAALDGVELDDTEKVVYEELKKWDYTMSVDNVVADFFQNYNNRLIYVTIAPWWDHFQVPDNPDVDIFPDGGSYVNQIFRGTLVHWLEQDRDNHWLSLPDGTHRSAQEVLVQAFRETVQHQVEVKGAPFEKWGYGAKYEILFPSLLSPSLDRGPWPFGGSSRSINAAVGTQVAGRGAIQNTVTGGPTWRFIIDWGTGQAQAVLAGGQSENALSPWYDNGLSLWLAGGYWPVYEGDDVPVAATWRLQA